MVGELLDVDTNSWIFQGVYSNQDVAISKCVKDNFFVSRIEIDFDEPTEMLERKDDTYYPLLEKCPWDVQ